MVLEVNSQIVPQSAEALHPATMVHEAPQHAGPILEAAMLHFGWSKMVAGWPALLVLSSSCNGRCGHVDGHTECWTFGCNVVDCQRNPSNPAA